MNRMQFKLFKMLWTIIK